MIKTHIKKDKINNVSITKTIQTFLKGDIKHIEHYYIFLNDRIHIQMKQVLTILGFLVIGLLSENVFACSCVGKSTVKGAYKSSDIIMSGEVVSLTDEFLPDSAKIKEMIALGISTDNQNKWLYGYSVKKVLIKVDNILKGQLISDTLTIITGLGGGDCGFEFKLGQKYIIYGFNKNYFNVNFKNQDVINGQNVYWTNICTRTQEYNRNEFEKLVKLRNKKQPRTNIISKDPFSN